MKNKMSLIFILTVVSTLHTSDLPTLEISTAEGKNQLQNAEKEPLLLTSCAKQISDQPRTQLNDLEKKGWTPTGKGIFEDNDDCSCADGCWDNVSNCITGKGCTFTQYFLGKAYAKNTNCCAPECCSTCCESLASQCCSSTQY